MSTVTATILGGMIAGVFGIIASFVAVRLQSFAKAASNLRVAFNEELIALHGRCKERPVDAPSILRAAYTKHLTAVVEFGYHLDPIDADGFDRAWYEYAYKDGAKDNDVDFDQYGYQLGEEVVNQWHMNDLATRRIEAILAYTKRGFSRHI